MAMVYEIMSKFPLLCASEDLKSWTGFISTKRQAVLLALYVPGFPNAENVRLMADEVRVKTRCTDYWGPLMDKVCKEAKYSFLKYLEDLEKLELQKCKSQLGVTEITDVAAAVIEEIEAIGVSNVTSLSSSFKEMVIVHTDEFDRKHELKLSVPAGYPKANVVVTAELPFSKNYITWPGTILGAHQMFKQYVEKCCDFWDDMDVLDNKVKIVDPIQPTRSHYHRKILLEDNVIIHLIFNALAPRSLPEISFSGPEHFVKLFSSSIDGDCNQWDENLTVIQNLESILECVFISKDFGDSENDNDADDQTLCAVCFAYNFGEELPDVTCTCGAMFHPQCVLDLFANEVKTTTCIRRCVECPNCQMDVRVPMNTAGPRW